MTQKIEKIIRRIVRIDRNKCNGCALCAEACHEGAIGLRDGKAELLRDDYCDGLGDCLPACPTGAISFEERAALPYDEAAVLANMAASGAAGQAVTAGLGGALAFGQKSGTLPCGCPGSQSRSLGGDASADNGAARPVSCLAQWPVQIKLVPADAPYFAGADVLVAADCTAFARGDFHSEFMRGRITLIGCPKLDAVDYTEKLSAIFSGNKIKSVSVARMSVPCCGGLESAAAEAVRRGGKALPFRVISVNPDGSLR